MRKYLLHILIISFVFAFQVSAYDKTDLKKAKATRDCSDCDLSDADLSDANLNGANLRKADL
ncbi:MAG TPA: pentapeptide repeat-containing protein, partial [Candidatus Marinimicrobia bacterium]|nr:pentapeptide repeat-containing protein [Candidatus Neomarinimicrobiota bacterium]